MFGPWLLNDSIVFGLVAGTAPKANDHRAAWFPVIAGSFCTYVFPKSSSLPGAIMYNVSPAGDEPAA